MAQAVIDTIGYVRVSTEQQAGETSTSLPEQRRAITEHALKLGRNLDPSSIFEDPGVSGATAERRPGFMAMLRYCQEHPMAIATPGIVVILNDSRFGRFDDAEEAGHWRFVFKKLGWLVRFAEGDDVQDGVARGVLRYIGAAQATEYRQNLRRTAKRASRATAEAGRWGCEAPFGYRRLGIRKDGQSRILERAQRKAEDEIVKLTPGPDDEVAAVRWMFQTYAAGLMTTTAIAREMAKRHPRVIWSPPVVSQVLKNVSYLGIILWGRRAVDAEGKLRPGRNPHDRVVYPNAHTALVSEELFERVKTRLALNRSQTRASKGAYPLSGIIRCGSCGFPFTGGGGPHGPNDRWMFLKCSGATKFNPVCSLPAPTINQKWVQGVIVNAIAELVAHPSTQAMIAKQVRELVRQSSDGGETRRNTVIQEREQLLARRKRLVDMVAAGSLKEEEAALSLDDLRSQLSACEAEYEQLRFTERTTVQFDEECDRLIALAQDFPTQIRRASGVTFRELVRPWIKSATVVKESRTLCLVLWKLPFVDSLMDFTSQRGQG